MEMAKYYYIDIDINCNENNDILAAIKSSFKPKMHLDLIRNMDNPNNRNNNNRNNNRIYNGSGYGGYEGETSWDIKEHYDKIKERDNKFVHCMNALITKLTDIMDAEGTLKSMIKIILSSYLYKFIIKDINNTTILKSIPRQISELINLRKIDFKNCFLKNVPSEIMN